MPETNQDPARLLTTFEVAELTQFRPKTIRKMARRREIPCLPLGGEYRFRRDAIVAWMAEKEEAESLAR